MLVLLTSCFPAGLDVEMIPDAGSESSSESGDSKDGVPIDGKARELPIIIEFIETQECSNTVYVNDDLFSIHLLKSVACDATAGPSYLQVFEAEHAMFQALEVMVAVVEAEHSVVTGDHWFAIVPSQRLELATSLTEDARVLEPYELANISGRFSQSTIEMKQSFCVTWSTNLLEKKLRGAENGTSISDTNAMYPGLEDLAEATIRELNEGHKVQVRDSFEADPAFYLEEMTNIISPFKEYCRTNY